MQPATSSMSRRRRYSNWQPLSLNSTDSTLRADVENVQLATGITQRSLLSASSVASTQARTGSSAAFAGTATSDREARQDGGSTELSEWSSGHPSSSASPLSGILNGNGLSFGTSSVPLPPLVAQATSFVRIYCTTSWTPTFMSRLGDARVRSRILRIAKAALHWIWEDIVHTYPMGYWSAIAAGMNIFQRHISQDVAKALEQHRMVIAARSLAVLRGRLTAIKDTDTPNMVTFFHVLSLFSDAALSGDVRGAHILAKTFRQLVDRSPDQDCEIRLLRVVLWGNATSATLQVRRPAFDHFSWIPRILSSFWQRPESMLSEIASESSHLPEVVQIPALAEAFLFARKALAVLRVPSAAWRGENMIQTTTVCLWVATRANHHEYCLLDLYFDLIAEHPRISSYLITDAGEPTYSSSVITCVAVDFEEELHGRPLRTRY